MQNRISSVITLPFIQAFIHCFGQHDEIVEFTLRWGIPSLCTLCVIDATLCYSRNLYINNYDCVHPQVITLFKNYSKCRI